MYKNGDRHKIHDSDRNQYGTWLRAAALKTIPKTNSQSSGKKSLFGSSSFEEKLGGDKEDPLSKASGQARNLSYSDEVQVNLDSHKSVDAPGSNTDRPNKEIDYGKESGSRINDHEGLALRRPRPSHLC